MDKTCHVIDHCDVLRGPLSVGDPALARSSLSIRAVGAHLIFCPLVEVDV